MIPAVGGEGVDHHVRTAQKRACLALESFPVKIISEITTPVVRIEPRASRNVVIVLILPRVAHRSGRVKLRKGDAQRPHRVSQQ
jgi:hypothetical protein